MLYYLPKKATIKRADVEAMGLGYIFVKGEEPTQQQCIHGPDGGSGVLFWAGGTRRYDRKAQTWIKQDGFWLGFATDAPPTPEDLDRGAGLHGDFLELADGNQWKFTPSGVLPERFMLNTDGEPVSAPLPKYSDHYEACQWLFDKLSNLQEADECTAIDFIERLATVLSCNYRVSFREVMALGLFTSANFITASFAALGVKKNEGTEQ